MCLEKVCLVFTKFTLFRSLWLMSHNGGIVKGSGKARDRFSFSIANLFQEIRAFWLHSQRALAPCDMYF